MLPERVRAALDDYVTAKFNYADAGLTYKAAFKWDVEHAESRLLSELDSWAQSFEKGQKLSLWTAICGLWRRVWHL